MAKTVVILVHGIRTHATWMHDIPEWMGSDKNLEFNNAGYDYLDAFRFWFPFFTRKKALDRVEHKISVALGDHPPEKWKRIIIAHSFGTYATLNALEKNAHWKIDDLLLCGSIVPSDYNWTTLRNQISGRIINECGRYDIWPVAAKSFSWGYGNTGTHGAHDPSVKDRFHPFKHSDYFNAEFVSKFWGDFVKRGTVHPSQISPSDVKTPAWLWLLEWPWKWLFVFVPILWMASTNLPSSASFADAKFLFVKCNNQQTIEENKRCQNFKKFWD